ncbi:BMC domain-containing protein [Pseudonocardia asaccharolytica]|uniref:Carboxysome shell protein n=1 Tax=Pseudonocardia asaccharolytica DSM 44247 = NBRC 16224 TaxID=1123024 RepID=A0A511CXC4_9PSEU|nr:BMC domain-containing protein [Pseudonocardia asaccharolytica]GEL17209.1 carboxysome shell protein [Pseudonocardia asaccharolytica DSM 44247 = NBRC 16224]
MASDRAIGLIETRGVVALSAGIEAMLKTADVRCIAIERVSSGYLVAGIQGTLAAVRQAVEAGTAAVQQHGLVHSAQVYPKPHSASAEVLAAGPGQVIRQVVEAIEGRVD